MIISIFGHKQANLSDRDKRLIKKLFRYVLYFHPEAVFYLCDYGEFDKFCNETLNGLKEEYRFLKRILVMYDVYYNDYYTNVIKNYDHAIYTFSDDGIPNNSVLSRNEWMVNNSDLFITFVYRKSQVAGKTLDFAKDKNKPYINIGKYRQQKTPSL